MEKTCSQCKQTKLLSEFTTNKAAKFGVQPFCRDCGRKYAQNYYLRNKKKVHAASRAALKRKRDVMMDLVSTYKATHPCIDCGQYYNSCVMDFDHRDPSTKTGVVAWLLTRTPARIWDEIAKCDLVCANCHRVRTHVRAHFDPECNRHKACIQVHDPKLARNHFRLVS